jgi:hypothetical protein
LGEKGSRLVDVKEQGGAIQIDEHLRVKGTTNLPAGHTATCVTGRFRVESTHNVPV